MQKLLRFEVARVLYTLRGCWLEAQAVGLGVPFFTVTSLGAPSGLSKCIPGYLSTMPCRMVSDELDSPIVVYCQEYTVPTGYRHLVGPFWEMYVARSVDTSVSHDRYYVRVATADASANRQVGLSPCRAGWFKLRRDETRRVGWLGHTPSSSRQGIIHPLLLRSQDTNVTR